jgi:hypothetical protein
LAGARGQIKGTREGERQGCATLPLFPTRHVFSGSVGIRQSFPGHAAISLRDAKTTVKWAVVSGLWTADYPTSIPLLASIKLVCDKGPTRPSRANVDELKTGFEISPLTFTNNKVHMSRLLCSSLQPMPSPSRWKIRVPDKSPELSCESDNQMDVQLRLLVCRLQSPFVVPVLVIYN